MRPRKKELSGIRLIAKELGVSTATISRALNPETCHKVKESRRRQILELADQMHYRPNPGARILQRGHQNSIAVLVPSEEDLFFSEFYGRFLGGLISSVDKAGWGLQINTFNPSEDNHLDELRYLGLGTSGLIYLSSPLTTEQVDALSGFHRPLILINSALPPKLALKSVPCHVLGAGNSRGASLAVKHLLELNHQRIGLIMGPLKSRDFEERHAAYIRALRQGGIEVSDEAIYLGSYNQETGRAGCEYFLSRPTPPTALLCANDSIAFGALDFLKEQGLSCPKDLSIIGYDDGPWATACSPKLTTIRQPLRAMSERAVSLLLHAVDNHSNKYQHILMDPVLNVRESTSLCRS
jgi:LacI family transcriptional regulator